MSRYQVEVTELRPIEVNEAELMTLSEATRRLGISKNTLTGLLQRGVLRRIVDTQEPNPTRAGRVLRAEVEAEIARRRKRQDTRLKRSRRLKRSSPE